jgi:DNA-directed RNA polymerase specialized sigma24 family protein
MRLQFENLSNIQVVEGFQRHDEAVESQFYQDCRQRLSDVQDDLFQDSFLTLWTEMETGKIHVREGRVCRFDREGVSRPMTASLTTYLASIVKFKNMEVFREAALCLHPDALGTDSPDAFGIDRPDEEAPEMTLADIVALMFNALPKHCRDILSLFYYEGKTLDEILEERREQHVSKDGLKSGKSKCMTQLKRSVMEECEKYHLSPVRSSLARTVRNRREKYDRMAAWERWMAPLLEQERYRCAAMVEECSCCYMKRERHAPTPYDRRWIHIQQLVKEGQTEEAIRLLLTYCLEEGEHQEEAIDLMAKLWN